MVSTYAPDHFQSQAHYTLHIIPWLLIWVPSHTPHSQPSGLKTPLVASPSHTKTAFFALRNPLLPPTFTASKLLEEGASGTLQTSLLHGNLCKSSKVTLTFQLPNQMCSFLVLLLHHFQQHLSPMAGSDLASEPPLSSTNIFFLSACPSLHHTPRPNVLTSTLSNLDLTTVCLCLCLALCRHLCEHTLCLPTLLWHFPPLPSLGLSVPYSLPIPMTGVRSHSRFLS